MRGGGIRPLVCLFSVIACIVVSGCRPSGQDGPASEATEHPMPTRPIEDVLKDHTPELMAIDGVVGTAEGEQNGRPCILVFLARDTGELRDRIPSQIEGYPVKVQVTGEITPLRRND